MVDVAKVLGFKKPRDAVQRVPEQWMKIVVLDPSVHNHDTLNFFSPNEFDNRVKQITVLTEPAIYHLIFRSRIPSAIAFQEWVFEEVLPVERKIKVYTSACFINYM